MPFAGESGLGKSTLVRSLFLTNLFGEKSTRSANGMSLLSLSLSPFHPPSLCLPFTLPLLVSLLPSLLSSLSLLLPLSLSLSVKLCLNLQLECGNCPSGSPLAALVCVCVYLHVCVHFCGAAIKYLFPTCAVLCCVICGMGMHHSTTPPIIRWYI